MRENISQTFTQILNSSKLPWVIIFIGIALRLIRYLYNPSLWFDESVIATDIIQRSLTDLINPSPDYTQTGPLGFYMLSKVVVQLFGNSEYALRFIPLFFGTTSLLLFYKVAKDILKPGAVLIAITLFALLDPLIYYSSELKPYSGDVLAALLILAFAFHKKDRSTTKHIIIFSIIGAIAVTSSNPSVFVLGGVGTGLILSFLEKKDWKGLRSTLVTCLVWAICFGAVYLFYLSNITAEMAKDMSMEKAFKMEKFYMPFPPKSLMDIKWYIDMFFETFSFQDSIIYTKTVTLSSLMAFSFLTGSVLMFSEKRKKFYLLIFPVLLTLSAAAIHQYPFKGRQILFLAPIFLLIISEGAEYIREKISKTHIMIGVIFIGLIFTYPVSWAAYHTKKPITRSLMKPALTYVKSNWHDGDIIYTHFFAQYEIDYYLKRHPEPVDFNESDIITGIGPRGWYNIWRKNMLHERYNGTETITQSTNDILSEYRTDLDMLKGRKRVWILFAGDVTMEDFFLSYLDSIGERMDSFGHSGLTSVYLYDLDQ